jgi:quercetin 2,3-dioxygenase
MLCFIRPGTAASIPPDGNRPGGSVSLFFEMNAFKAPAQQTQLSFKQNAPGFRSVDIFNGELEIEPYLVFTEFYMDRPIFGPHPHAGMSVLTYMLPDSEGGFINRDSQGDHSRIEPGGAHITQAGAGILHDEIPEHTGTSCHGMQIWINHADADRFVPARPLHASPTEIPEVQASGASVRVVLGEYNGATSPLVPVTRALLLDVTLEPGATFTLPVQPTCFVYVLQGEVETGDARARAQTLLVYDTIGDAVQLRAGDQPTNFLLASGTPHHEPIVHGGPFVGTTQEQISEMRRRFSRGEMGTLEAV